jgi:hypothetical protein
MQNAELLDRIATLEARVAALEARPQPATIGGAGNSGAMTNGGGGGGFNSFNWPWPTLGAVGASGGPATPAGMNESDK